VRRLGRDGLRHDDRGAVLVEFVVAIVPVLMVFFSLAQLSAIASASLLVRHAAFVAARAAAVVNPGMADSGPAGDISASASLVLTRFMPSLPLVTPQLAGPQTQGMQSVNVTLVYPCSVPLGDVIVCGPGLIHMLTASSAFPNQGSFAQSVWKM
jgi:Flp pilus assembly protein TadG